MDAVGLPARIGYAIAALPLGGALGFYSSILLLPKLVDAVEDADPGMEGLGVFTVALGVGAALAVTASLVALTLPGKRRRKSRGRGGRFVLSCVLVLVASLGFAGGGHGLIYDLAFAGWLAYTMAFTFVRYGVIDQARRTPVSAQASSAM